MTAPSRRAKPPCVCAERVLLPNSWTDTRDKQEVAGYAEAMDLVFLAHDDLTITENHINQPHQTLLRHSTKDGNRRLSHVLTTLLLLQARYAYLPFASLESVIEANKDIHYKSLRRTQTIFKSADPDHQQKQQRLSDDRGNAANTRCNQQGVRDGANQPDDEDMQPGEALAQNKGVLRPDGNNKARPRPKLARPDARLISINTFA